MRFRIVLHITIFFEDSIIIWENNEKIFLEGGDIDIGIFYVKTIDNTMKTIMDLSKLSPNSITLSRECHATPVSLILCTAPPLPTTLSGSHLLPLHFSLGSCFLTW